VRGVGRDTRHPARTAGVGESEDAMTNMPFGKHKGQPLSEVPIDYIWWLNDKNLRDPLRSALNAELERRDSKKRKRKTAAVAA
jgi:exodeoxyribonuclease X